MSHHTRRRVSASNRLYVPGNSSGSMAMPIMRATLIILPTSGNTGCAMRIWPSCSMYSTCRSIAITLSMSYDCVSSNRPSACFDSANSAAGLLRCRVAASAPLGSPLSRVMSEPSASAHAAAEKKLSVGFGDGGGELRSLLDEAAFGPAVNSSRASSLLARGSPLASPHAAIASTRCWKCRTLNDGCTFMASESASRYLARTTEDGKCFRRAGVT